MYWGEDIGESESLSYLQSSNVKIAFQTEAPPIDPSRQKKEFIQQFIERKKIKILKPNKFGKVFAARTTCIESEQKILHGAFGREARQRGLRYIKGNAMKMLISSPTMKFRSVGEVDQKHFSPSLNTDVEPKRYTVGDNLGGRITKGGVTAKEVVDNRRNWISTSVILVYRIYKTC